MVLLAGPGPLNSAADKVLQHERSVAGHFKAHDRPTPLGLECGALCVGFGQKAAAVDEISFFRGGGLPFGLNFLGGGIVVVSRAGFNELLYGRLITTVPVGLKVGSMGAAHLGSFIPIDA